MEELLNKLIEKGWKPFGDERIVPYVKTYLSRTGCIQIAFYKLCDDGMYQWLFEKDIRTVLSKESGLWQFVCENGMVELTEYYGVCNWMFGENKYYDETETEKFYTHRDYEYRLIESALKDESELESFILDNIKV